LYQIFGDNGPQIFRRNVKQRGEGDGISPVLGRDLIGGYVSCMNIHPEHSFLVIRRLAIERELGKLRVEKRRRQDEDMNVSEGWRHWDRDEDMEDELLRGVRRSTNLQQ
jgi:hypothetical protein